MLSYDNARLLQAAGFPDTKIVRQGVHEIDNWFSPSLEVLIGACGEGFIALERAPGGFYAKIRTEKLGINHKFGNTGLDAVALAWLELNSKK